MAMKNLYIIKLQLTTEQNKVFEEVLLQWEDTVQAYKYLQKKYSGVKRNIKAIEKKLVKELSDSREDSFTLRWVEREVASIENKYASLDKAIKNYRQAMQSFNHMVGLPNFRTFNPTNRFDWHITNLKNSLSRANMEITGALDGIRITKRYFNNITTAFKAHATRQKMISTLAISRLPAVQDL
jgi:exonuclease VII small subunit